MNSQRRLAIAAYFVAFLVVVIPLFDASMSVYPWHPGSTQWRFGAVGLLSNALLIPLLGALVAVATAAGRNDARTLRVFTVMSWVTAFIVILSVLFFGLDSLQASARIRPEIRLSFRVATLTAALKLLLGGMAFVLFGRACRSDRVVRPESATAASLVLKHRDTMS